MDTNSDGDYIILANVNDISKVVLYGDISSSNPKTNWYCGGLLFNIKQSNGNIALAYKEYVFNKDNTSVTIDFSSLDNIKCNDSKISLKDYKIIDDNFLVSIVWWTSSSDFFDNTINSDISLTLDSIEVIYKDGINISDAPNYTINHTNFTNTFNNDIPSILSSVSSFYIITDDDYNVIEVNDGNLFKPLSDNDIFNYIDNITYNTNKRSGNVTINDISYNYKIVHNNNLNIIIFIYDGFKNLTLNKLLLISSSVGVVLLLILFVIILIVSKSVVEPIQLAVEKQKQFISNASHELKTPITVISATVDLLKTQFNDNRLLTCIKEQSEKMGKLVQELLSLAKISEITDNYSNFKNFNLSKILNNSILSFECSAYEQNKSITTNIDNDISFYGDENQISQLIDILIDNALKYSTKDTSINVSLYIDKNKICLKCSNYCDNITHNDISKLFERFFRTNNKKKVLD